MNNNNNTKPLLYNTKVKNLHDKFEALKLKLINYNKKKNKNKNNILEYLRDINELMKEYNKLKLPIFSKKPKFNLSEEDRITIKKKMLEGLKSIGIDIIIKVDNITFIKGNNTKEYKLSKDNTTDNTTNSKINSRKINNNATYNPMHLGGFFDPSMIALIVVVGLMFILFCFLWDEGEFKSNLCLTIFGACGCLPLSIIRYIFGVRTGQIQRIINLTRRTNNHTHTEINTKTNINNNNNNKEINTKNNKEISTKINNKEISIKINNNNNNKLRRFMEVEQNI